MRAYQPLNPAQLTRVEAQVARQSHRLQPELRGLLGVVHVYVRRLIDQIVAVKVEPVGSNTQHGGHAVILLAMLQTCQLTRSLAKREKEKAHLRLLFLSGLT
jgi:hypothetical protein